MNKIIVTENGTETVSYEFTEMDLELLKKPLPDAPCQKCKDSDFCCGCSKYEYYKNISHLYEDNGVYDFAYTLRAMNSLLQQIIQLQEKYEEYEKELPSEVRELFLKKTKKLEEESC